MNYNSEKFYDRFSFLYPLIDLFLMPQKKKFLREINRHPHGQLLEIGVGNGAHFKYYTNHHIITGIDTSTRMLAYAQRHLKNNIQIFHMNGEALSFPNEAFDYVILSHVIAVVDSPEKLLREAHRVLRPNGKVFVLNHFTPDNGLKYLDRAMSKIARLVCLRSEFPAANLQNVDGLKLIRQSDAGMLSYFKMMIYEKNR